MMQNDFNGCLSSTCDLQAGHHINMVPEQQVPSMCSLGSSSLDQDSHTTTLSATQPEQLQPKSSRSTKLEFKDISYWLPAPPLSLRERIVSARLHRPVDSKRLQDGKGKKRYGKQLLLCVSGSANAGRLLAVMGPSGAGKTTLLSILAGERAVVRPSSGRLSGQVLLAGQERHLPAFKKISAHVKQDDMLLPTTTPREALLFAAALRLPGSSPTAKQARVAAVQDMLEGMCLQHCADTLVGESRDGVKGLSGGERRRLAVAAELLGRPSLALLDEPSSGQDSSTAVQVLSFIKQHITSAQRDFNKSSGSSRSSTLSPAGVLVITLHQPGREITALLDDLLLLAPGGRAVYMGPWVGALPYFQEHLQLTPPQHTGLAEWYLSLLTSQGLGGMNSSSSSSLSSMSGGLGASNADSPSAHRVGHSSSSDTICRLNLHEAWIAYTTAQQPIQQPEEHDVYSCHSSLAAKTHSKQEPDVWSVLVRVVEGRDTTHSSSSEEHVVATSEQAAHASEIEVAAAASTASTAGTTQHAGSVADTRISVCCLEQRIHSYKADAMQQQQPALLPQSVATLGGNRHVTASWWVQVCVLSMRNLRYWWRCPAMVLSEAAQYMFVVLFLGSIYPRLPSEGSAAAVDRLAALFMWLVTLLVTAPSRALLSWDMERQLLRHELASGAYGLTPFLISKLAVGLPLETLMVSVAGSLLYVLLGLQPMGAKFGAFLAVNVLCALSAHNFGNLLGLCLPSLHAALPALCVGATLLLSFAGFIVQAVPVWWAWMGDVSFCTYAYAAMVRNEFEGLQLKLPAGSALSTGGAAGSGLSAAAQNALQAAFKTELPGLRNSAANITALIDAQVQQHVAVEGLDLVPETVRVHFGTVQQFIGLLLAFTVGSSVLVVALTALLVRFKYR